MENTINDIIKQRRSIYPKEFNGNILNEGIIITLLENANYAPNHLSNYPWFFVVIKGKALKQFIMEAASIYTEETPTEKFRQSKKEKIEGYANKISHVIAIIMHRDPNFKTVLNEDICAVASAVQNIYLSLSQFEHAGGYWSTGLGTYSLRMKDYLNLSENETLMGYFLLGEVDDKRKEGNRRDLKNYFKYM